VSALSRPGVDYAEPSWARRIRFFWRDPDRITLANVADELAKLYGDRTALRLDEGGFAVPGLEGSPTMSYAQLAEGVARIAGGLQTFGVRRGDRVGLMTMNRVEMLLVAMAAARLGAIPVPLNFLLQVDEIDTIARRAGFEVLVADRTILNGVLRDRAAVPTVRTWVDLEGSGSDVPSLLDQARAARPVPPAHVGAREPALIFFTSGTTGAPKGATLSHDAAVVGVRHTGRIYALRPRMGAPLALAVMPVAHVGGYAALLTYLAIGWPVLFSPRFDPEVVLDLLERWHATAFTGTPAMYRILLDAGAADRDLRSIEVWGGGADAFSDDLVRTMRDLGARRSRFGRRRRPMFIRGYGMAEANSYVAQSPPMPAGDRCLGWVLPPVRSRIVDENGADVARGEPGELLLSGPTIADGYWNDPDETARCFQGGWFHTGDLVRQGRLRLLYFVDRSRDLIKSGGFKIAAAEIDNVIEAHPAVLHSATVGLPHATLGEEVVSAVVLRPDFAATERDLIAWCRRQLAGHKCPRRVVFVDELPLTVSLKPKRRVVREMFADRAPKVGASAL
jgi:long-chain acyl-CoA synthetase